MARAGDTIYALSSGSLPAGVAVLRLSGEKSFEAMARLIGGPLPSARRVSLRMIRNRNDEVIDQALVLRFEAPHSFTGEDCVEFHLHGSRAAVAAVFAELGHLQGLRPADAGEFSARAFENGKLDLLEVEGLADLLRAETEMQRRLAMEQSSGKLSALYNDWADRLTRARALIDAELDFADEENISCSAASQVWVTVESLRRELEDHLAGAEAAAIMRDGFKVALVGAPNVGKSTLLNALSNRDVAIVTDVAGTTRDVLSVDLNMDGYLVTLFDTAGLRETADIVEKEGVRRALGTAASADLVLLLRQLDSDTKQISEQIMVPMVELWTKSDLAAPGAVVADALVISAKTGAGLGLLRDRIKIEIDRRMGSATMLAPVRARHKKRLEEMLNYVRDALNTQKADLAIRSEFLRLAATALGRITGRVDVEDLLDVIFSEFCIGK